MEDNRIMSSYNFQEALFQIDKNFDNEDIYKLGIEIQDPDTHKISIKKFNQIYNKLFQEGFTGRPKTMMDGKFF